LERQDWVNLNGLWNYAITPLHSVRPHTFDGEILVPFPVESSLSGVQKSVGEEHVLWYERTMNVPSSWSGKRVLLHFGAVDWQADVWVNDIKVGRHTGGYTPFSFDITPCLTKTGSQRILVKVWDPADKGFQPRGKQVSRPGSIWYTSVTGIWQTVWMEAVPEQYITQLKTTPDIDKQHVRVKAIANFNHPNDIAEVTISLQGQKVATGKAVAGAEAEIEIPNIQLWSPEHPVLYDMEVVLWNQGKKTDRVKSYFAMRKIGTKRDANGVVRLQLNNQDYFQLGPLDQGWWPDGLYTAPTDEALCYDIQMTKELGFNMIRKHVKVEPARWYHHCDQLGILVWQDMPSGDRSPQWQMRQYFTGSEWVRTPESESNFKKEWQEIIDYLFSYPCVVTWVPFNEAWGQFKTLEITSWTKQYDPSRLVNPASGGNHFLTGDMLDIHNYPEPVMYLYDATRATVLGEYGGIGLALKGHLWEEDRNWGYVQFTTQEEVTNEYVKFGVMLKNLVPRGFSAAVYTQTTDVEIEVNGLMTYDRKELKMNLERVRKINLEVRGAIDASTAQE
jgi:beta-galactosidase/beta-glucuronidase